MIVMVRLLFATLLLCLSVHGAVYYGSLQSPDTNWHYLGKFCFSDDFGGTGSLNYTIHTSNTNLQIMLYLGTTNYSDVGAWEPVYSHRNDYSCQQLVDMHRPPAMENVVSGYTGNFAPHQQSHAYFWYVAVADCTATEIDISEFKLVFLNPGGIWETQFSYDEQGVLQYLVFYIIVYFVTLAVHLWGIWQLYKMNSWHHIIKIFSASLLLAFIATFSQTIHFAVYMHDGIGAIGLRALGELAKMCSQLLMMFLCILISKGWVITTNFLTHRTAIIVSMSVFVLAYLSLFIWDNAGRDPASTLYFYDSIPGLIVILLRLALTAWFLWNLRVTIKLELLPEKRNFYYVFGGIYTVWLLALPTIVTFALVLDPWYRFRTVTGLLLTADLLAFIIMLIMLWPTRVTKYFNVKGAPNLLDTAGNQYGAIAITQEL